MFDFLRRKPKEPHIDLRLLAYEAFIQAVATDDRLPGDYQEQAQKLLGWR